MKKLFPLGILLCTSSFLFAQDFKDVEIKTIPVKDNIYMLMGMGGNIGVLGGEDGFIIVDDQFEPLADKIKAALAQIDDREVVFAINTHFHYDHADGNKAFGRDGALIVAHENGRKYHLKDEFIEVPGFDTTFQAAYPQEALPKITFRKNMKLHLNGQTIHIFHPGNAHTDTDVIVYFEESNVFHMGDVFVRYGIPYVDEDHGGSVKGMIAAANKVIAMSNPNTIIIPGHGDLAKRQDLIEFRDKLQIIVDRVAVGIDDGKSLSDIIDTNPTEGLGGIMDKAYFAYLIYEELGQ